LDEDVILAVRGLSKHYPLVRRSLFNRKVEVVKACDDVSFELRRGETLGIVGESGCGKTTLGRAILRAIRPSSGEVWFRSRRHADPIDLATASEATLKGLRTELQMIFQDPYSSLNPYMTVQQIVEEPLRIHGIARGAELEDRVTDMLRKVGLPPECRRRYPHAFSGGQRQRISIARALILRPALLVCDEAVASLDVSVQAHIINLLMDLQEEFKLTYLFVSHSLPVVRHIADRVALLHHGKLVELSDTEQFFTAPRHVRSSAFLAASTLNAPDPDADVLEQTEA
jgi:peptide/nickel transport system ATP-binding protein